MKGLIDADEDGWLQSVALIYDHLKPGTNHGPASLYDDGGACYISLQHVLYFLGIAGSKNTLGFLSAQSGPKLQGCDIAGDTGITTREKAAKQIGIMLRSVELNEAGCIPITHQQRSDRRSSKIFSVLVPCLPVPTDARKSSSCFNHASRSGWRGGEGTVPRTISSDSRTNRSKRIADALSNVRNVRSISVARAVMADML